MKKRCISEGGKLISDLLEISHVLNKQRFLVTAGIENTFESVYYLCLIAILERNRFYDWFYWMNKNINK